MKAVGTAAIAAGAVAAGIAYMQSAPAQSASTVMDQLNSISSRLATIESALGVNFEVRALAHQPRLCAALSTRWSRAPCSYPRQHRT